jgi:hypothetical protein
MTWLLVEDDVDVLHVEIELEMTWIACIKRLKVSGMTWLLVEDNVYDFACWDRTGNDGIASVKRLEVTGMA